MEMYLVPIFNLVQHASTRPQLITAGYAVFLFSCFSFLFCIFFLFVVVVVVVVFFFGRIVFLRLKLENS